MGTPPNGDDSTWQGANTEPWRRAMRREKPGGSSWKQGERAPSRPGGQVWVGRTEVKLQRPPRREEITVGVLTRGICPPKDS